MVGVGGLEARASPIANFVFLNGSYQDEQGGSGMDKVEYYLKYDTDKVGNSLDYGYNKVCDTNTKNWFGGYSCNGNLDYSLNDRILSAVAVATDKAGNRRTIGVYNYPNQNKIDVLTIKYLGDPIGGGVITGLVVGGIIVSGASLGTIISAGQTGFWSTVGVIANGVTLAGCTQGLYQIVTQNNGTLSQESLSCASGTAIGLAVGTTIKIGSITYRIISKTATNSAGKTTMSLSKVVSDCVATAPNWLDQLLGGISVRAACGDILAVISDITNKINHVLLNKAHNWDTIYGSKIFTDTNLQKTALQEIAEATKNAVKNQGIYGVGGNSPNPIKFIFKGKSIEAAGRLDGNTFYFSDAYVK